MAWLAWVVSALLTLLLITILALMLVGRAGNSKNDPFLLGLPETNHAKNGRRVRGWAGAAFAIGALWYCIANEQDARAALIAAVVALLFVLPASIGRAWLCIGLTAVFAILFANQPDALTAFAGGGILAIGTGDFVEDLARYRRARRTRSLAS